VLLVVLDPIERTVAYERAMASARLRLPTRVIAEWILVIFKTGVMVRMP